jgi:uncharacterized membrane protein YtjA (UPF0391 family)
LPIDIGSSTAGALERIHLPVEDRTPLLNAPIVSAAQDGTLVDEHRADGNTALGKPCSASSIAANKKGSIAHQYRRTARLSHSSIAEGRVMLHMALVFLVVGLIAALLGFTTIAGASIAIAKFLAGLFLLLFLVFLIHRLAAGRRIMG